MDDLISRQAAIDMIHGTFSKSLARQRAEECINKVPAVQTFRRRGHWDITECYPHNVYCSECHARFAQTHWAVWEDGSLPRTFCPNCGACMKGEQDG